jgi:hypothetical protein
MTRAYHGPGGREVVVYDPWQLEPLPQPTVDNSRAEALAAMLRTSNQR